jgi:hypothetical protein
MNRTAITIPTAMAIKTHIFKWSTGVVLDSASLTELFGDDIFLGLSDEQPYPKTQRNKSNTLKE